ncbi:class I SAM-dependent methyltransferase [Erythrobacter sp. YJ-T3-07]|uniref:SAM-dependent methyltransferase n=1 Tax=Erythrobacter sp. YJ-T3-07 TaxID=2793063 RepID=UPI0018D3FD09|nr:class I SAM-dependent methyltransferase [Erythrobacter sp. YJ-T3-07]MBH1943725.1 class I SAM-dependent methyltransferase [Erythrobacter sp. YJ-T3-07]
MWDERYSADAPAYGDEPNGFLVEKADLLKPGSVLCIAEGQGRNAVWLAGQGFTVTAMDQSPVGLSYAADLARRRHVALSTQVGDLSDFDLGESRWDNIVSIFGHLPGDLRRSVHRRIEQALTPGGCFLLEAYRPSQIEAEGTGGPGDVDMLLDLGKLAAELPNLEPVVGREVSREVNEGSYHHGLSDTVQFIGRKSA